MFNCIVCHGNHCRDTGKEPRDAKGFAIVECVSCKLIQLFPIPSVNEDQLFYAQDSQARFVHHDIRFDDVIEKSMPDAVRRVKFLDALYGNNRKEISVLEIGSGYGVFLKYAAAAGFNAEGIEISEARRAIASQITQVKINDYNLLKESLKSFTTKQYDVIAMFHVLEHIQSPVQFLVNAGTSLKAQGKIIIEVPNAADHLLDACTDYNNFYWQRAHLGYYRPANLTTVLTMAGFSKVKILGVQRYSVQNAMNWMLTGKPQISNPSYTVAPELQWLDNYYRQHLIDRLTCDTLIAIAEV